MKCLSEFNIDLYQVYTNTFDKGANILKISKLLRDMQEDTLMTPPHDGIFLDINPERISPEEQDLEIKIEPNQIKTLNKKKYTPVFSTLPCASHIIQLAAADVFELFKHEIQDIKVTSNKYNRDSKMSSEKNEHSTKWNSVYEMIKCIHNLRPVIENDGMRINWDFVESFVSTFNTLADFADKLRYQQYIIGDFFRDWLTCELELGDIMKTNACAQALYNSMNFHKDTLLQKNAVVAALYLDPRFNFMGTPLMTHSQKQAALVI